MICMPTTRNLFIMLAAVLLCAAPVNSWCQFQRSGPAAGGGFDPYAPPSFGTAFSSTDFRKMDCSPGFVSSGSDRYYTCNGMCLKKTFSGGKILYVVVPGPGS